MQVSPLAKSSMKRPSRRFLLLDAFCPSASKMEALTLCSATARQDTVGVWMEMARKCCTLEQEGNQAVPSQVSCFPFFLLLYVYPPIHLTWLSFCSPSLFVCSHIFPLPCLSLCLFFLPFLHVSPSSPLVPLFSCLSSSSWMSSRGALSFLPSLPFPSALSPFCPLKPKYLNLNSPNLLWSNSLYDCCQTISSSRNINPKKRFTYSLYHL